MSEMGSLFRVVAGLNLWKCGQTGKEEIDKVLAEALEGSVGAGKGAGTGNGKSPEMTLKVYADVLTVMSGGKEYCTDGGYSYAVMKGIEGAKYVPNMAVKVEESEEGTAGESGEVSKEVMNEAWNFYRGMVQNVKNNLIKKYTGMFASGYDVEQPTGIFSGGMVYRVSGSSKTALPDSVAFSYIQDILDNHMQYKEDQSRSNVKIADKIYSEYSSGEKTPLYFPNKMLEYAFGRKAPTGDNQDSLNTYEPHASAHNWSGYREEVKKSLDGVLGASVKGYVYYKMKELGVSDYKDDRIRKGIYDYMMYVEASLSTCLLFVDYKVDKQGETMSFKLRICDPSKKLMGVDLTPEIIQMAFGGSQGTEPMAMKPDVYAEEGIVEYSHEFNHSYVNGTPLFAYKALAVLQEQGRSISWDSLLLGKDSKGRMLTCGNDEGSINLSTHLVHMILAGSRAGKGVMTLNFLASAVASGKQVWYVDRKPDMASLIKHLCPNAFAVNGGMYSGKDDSFGMWDTGKMSGFMGNVPPEAGELFGLCGNDYYTYSDIFYLRAVLLTMGILLARDTTDPEWLADLGANDSMFIVFDEFTNFDVSFSSFLSTAMKMIPPLESYRQELLADCEKAMTPNSKGQVNQVKVATADRNYSNNFSDTKYYALSFVKMVMKSISFCIAKRNAAFSETLKASNDIFVLGQDDTKDRIRSGEVGSGFDGYGIFRKKEPGYKMSNTGGASVDPSASVIKSLVSLRPADVFFGRHDKILASKSTSSKAHGRCDDKASNFAYLADYTDDVRADINADEKRNIAVAERCRYFKPYLILKQGETDSQSVTEALERVHDNTGITAEESIAIDCIPGNESVINPAVGFEGYLAQAGLSDCASVLSKSGAVAQRVVQRMGYPGSWMEFICDLRPEWMFTVGDIATMYCSPNHECRVGDPTNDILSEWYAFNPKRFGGEGNTENVSSADKVSKFMESHMGDETDPDSADVRSQVDLAEAMGDLDEEKEELSSEDTEKLIEALSRGEEIDLDEEVDDGVGDKFGESERIKALMDVIEKQRQELERLKGTARVEEKVSGSDDDLILDGLHEGDYKNPVKQYAQGEEQRFDKEFDDVDFTDPESSLESMTNCISSSIIQTFGGLDRFRTFRVKGGSIVVNDTVYKCSLKGSDASKNIPYDVRMKLNSGNIDECFRYDLLLAMGNLTAVYFDSTEFFEDVVVPQIDPQGIPPAMDKLFRSCKNLDRIVLGKSQITRKMFFENRDEVLGNSAYNQSTRNRVASWTQGTLTKANSNAWKWTKKVWKDKHYKGLGGKAFKLIKLGAGVSASAVSGVANLGVKAGRQVVGEVEARSARNKSKEAAKNIMGGFKEGLKDLFK